MRGLWASLGAAVACAGVAGGAIPAHAATYYVGPGQMSAELRVTGDGKPELLGQFGTATASFDYDEASHALSRLRVAIDGESLSSSSYAGGRELTLMLEPDSYREIALAASGRATLSDGKAEMKGVLTLHGVSKPVTVQVAAMGGAADGGYAPSRGGVGLSLKVETRRGDFAIADDPDEERKFGNVLSLGVDMQGIRQ